MRRGNVELILFNLLGQRVVRRSLELVPGVNSLELNLDGVASGVYLVRLSRGRESHVGRIVFVR